MRANIYDTLMRQAPTTVDFYMGECIQKLEEAGVSNPLHNSPELLGRMIQACTNDYIAACIGQKITELSETLDDINVTYEKVD